MDLLEQVNHKGDAGIIATRSDDHERTINVVPDWTGSVLHRMGTPRG